MDFRVTDHTASELIRRKIPRGMLDNVLANPQQVVPGVGGRSVYQSKVDFGEGKIRLVRAVVDTSERPPVVVTAYRTSKIAKYWRTA